MDFAVTQTDKEHRLLVLGSLEEFVSLIEKAKQRGYYTVACDGYSGGIAKGLADRAYTVDVRNTSEIVALCREERIDGIVTSFSDLLFEQATRIAETAGLRWYMDTQRLAYYRNKQVMKDTLRQLGITTSAGRVLSRDFSEEELSGLRFPVVIKPLDSYGSRGIRVLRSPQEVRASFEDSAAYSSNGKALLEEYCPGREYNMMTWVQDGKVRVISLADREKNPQSGNEIPCLNRIVYPAKDCREIADKAADVLQRYVQAVGQREGPLSMQFFYTDDRVVVGEVAGRFFGYEHELVTYCCGFSFEELLLDYVYAPENIEMSFNNHELLFPRCCAGLYFLGKEGKTVAEDAELRALAADPHILEYSLYYTPGEVVDRSSGRPYFARFDITAPSREELDRVTEHFFRNAHARASDGTDILHSFYLQRDETE